MFFWDEAHENSYTRFRFTNNELFKKYSEHLIRGVFDDVYLLMEGFDGDHLSRWDVLDHLDHCMRQRGVDMPFIGDLAYPVMGFIFRERGFKGINYEHYKADIFGMVLEIATEYIDDAYRFAQLLTDRLIEEYKSGDRTIPMDEVANNLRRFPELAFLPYRFLEDAAYAVYGLLLENEI